MLLLLLLLLLQARPCARSRERYARRAAVVGKEQDGRVRSGRVLPLCVGKRKGKERERRGQRTQKAQKPKDTDWYSELLSRFGCATLHTVHTYTSHLIHTSHLTPHTHTSHSTLHTSHFTLHTSHHHYHHNQHGEGPRLLRDKLLSSLAAFLATPLSSATSAAFGGGGTPCCSQGPALAEREPPQPPRCAATLNGARMLIFLWLAWWGSHVSIGTGPAHRGSPPPPAAPDLATARFSSSQSTQQ
jgi:hypothetical protein